MQPLDYGYNGKIEGEIVVSRLDSVVNWIRQNSVWPMPMGLACCAIELMATGASRFDISRFGAEVTAEFSRKRITGAVEVFLAAYSVPSRGADNR